MINKFILATNNAHKVHEFKKILEPMNISCVSLKEANINVDIVEDGKTFEENAMIKAKTIYDITKIPTVADDSGISVDALGGAPGIFSARYGAPDIKTDEQRLFFLLKNMQGKENRKAHYTAAIACVIDDKTSFVVKGECFGKIAFEPKGENGFGYDPIFITDEDNITFAMTSEQRKNEISHRARALKLFKERLEKI